MCLEEDPGVRGLLFRSPISALLEVLSCSDKTNIVEFYGWYKVVVYELQAYSTDHAIFR